MIETVTVMAMCRVCKERHYLKLPKENYERWQAGELVQRAFPTLPADTRELLISQICGKCFDRMFSSGG